MASATAITKARDSAPAAARPSIQSVKRIIHRSHTGRFEDVGGVAVFADFVVAGGGISLRIEMTGHYKNALWHFSGDDKKQSPNGCALGVLMGPEGL